MRYGVWGGLVLCLAACPRFEKVATENVLPVVDAGPDRTVSAGETVTLTATADDPEGDPLSFRWRQTLGPPVALSDEASATAVFVAPAVRAVLVFEATASDGFGESVPDLVQIAIDYNGRPVAEPGGPWLTPNLKPLRLIGRASDPEGDPVTGYQWSVISGPAGADLDAVLQDAETATPIFAPTVKGVYLLNLAASDAGGFGCRWR